MPTDAAGDDGIGGEAVIGVDLGGTKISCGLVDSSGTVRFRHSARTPASRGRDAVLDACAETISLTLDAARAHGHTVRGMGIGSAGVIDPVTGIVLSATQTVSGWRGTDLVGEFGARLGLDCHALNDVHAHALGEAWTGAGRGHESMLLVAVGTGIGGAYLVDGRVHAGANSLAGHLGHVPCEEAVGVVCSCGREGHLEGVASGPGIHETYLRSGGDPGIADTKELLRALEATPQPEGQPGPSAVRLAARALGRALGGWINTFDPHVVVVGGGVAQSDGLWWHEVLAAAEGETLLPFSRYPVVRSQLSDAAIVGAARRALTGQGIRTS